MTLKVLFVCIHNSARSQMAEAFLKARCGDRCDVASAGLEPGTLNSLAVEAMRERGIDISGNTTKSVRDLLGRGGSYDYVITVCDEASGERCPVVPGVRKRLHWTFPDPSSLEGTHAERLVRIREIRDQIDRRIEDWCGQTCSSGAGDRAS